MGMPDACRFDFRYFDIYDASGTKAGEEAVSYTHLRAHETDSYLVCRLLLEKKKTPKNKKKKEM